MTAQPTYINDQDNRKAEKGAEMLAKEGHVNGARSDADNRLLEPRNALRKPAGPVCEGVPEVMSPRA